MTVGTALCIILEIVEDYDVHKNGLGISHCSKKNIHMCGICIKYKYNGKGSNEVIDVNDDSTIPKIFFEYRRTTVK